ncbi:sigma-54-dependent Fis family transcriptional regulator, partial [bacterium]|nr:sigma-54-dependent Fis family transcriptional regulator [bacterium]
MKQGAYDFLLKPVERADLVSTIQRAIDRRDLVVENRSLRDRIGETDAEPILIGNSPRMKDVRATIHRVAASSATVLIEGETGTGKEVVARTIHAASDRRHGPFIVVNCAALPDSLIESELFGHERGAYTGAETQRQGRFELADGGSLLLDEVGDMPLATQAKLLRVLQDG